MLILDCITRDSDLIGLGYGMMDSGEGCTADVLVYLKR